MQSMQSLLAIRSRSKFALLVGVLLLASTLSALDLARAQGVDLELQSFTPRVATKAEQKSNAASTDGAPSHVAPAEVAPAAVAASAPAPVVAKPASKPKPTVSTPPKIPPSLELPPPLPTNSKATKSQLGVKTKAAKTPPPQVATVDRLQFAMNQLRNVSKDTINNSGTLALAGGGYLEGIANTAVLARVIAAIYQNAEKGGWRSRDNFQIFPIENLVDTFPDLVEGKESRYAGLRVGVLSLKLNNARQRAVILTSTFQAIKASEEIRELYAKDLMAPMIEDATEDYDRYAKEILKKMSSDDRHESQYLPVVTSPSSWVVGCQNMLAGRFCVNAQVFDAYDTDPSVFYDALLGIRESNALVVEIRRQNIMWPIERTAITRGYKTCGCGGEHFGLDLTAAIGTPIRAVADGTIRDAKGFAGWGRAIVLEHQLPSGNKYLSLYAHLSKYKKGLRVGDFVRAGDVIGLSGNSGTSHGPHLHLEIRAVEEGKEPLKKPTKRSERPLDPLRVLNVFNMLFSPTENLTPR